MIVVWIRIVLDVCICIRVLVFWFIYLFFDLSIFSIFNVFELFILGIDICNKLLEIKIYKKKFGKLWIVCVLWVNVFVLCVIVSVLYVIVWVLEVCVLFVSNNIVIIVCYSEFLC